MTIEPHPLLAALDDPSPAAVADALRKLRFRDLKDPLVLRAVLRACADDRVVPGAKVEAADPFASFFTAGGAAEPGSRPTGPAASGATVAVIAADRLEKAGIPETMESATLLAAVLDGLADAGPLGPVAARLLAETKWPDPTEAVRIIVPAVCRHDVSLFQVLIKLPSTVLETVCALAASPFRPRLFQELMNHSPSQDSAVAAMVAAVAAGTADLDEASAVTLVSTLVAWNRREASGVAASLEPRWPLLLAWRALDDESQRARLREQLDAGGLRDVERFWPRVAEVLRHRESLPGYPVASFLRVVGTDPGVVAAVGVDDDVATVLTEWVAALGADPTTPAAVDRAWEAAGHLIRAERLGASRAVLEGALSAGDLARWPVFEGPMLAVLTQVSPPLLGLVDALCRAITLDPGVAGAVVEAAAGLDDSSVARVVERVLELAERAPRTTVRVSAKVVREAAEGIEVDVVESLLPRCGPAQQERFERVRAVLRAG